MRFTSSCLPIVSLVGLLAIGLPASAQEQRQPPQPSAEELVQSWEKLAHRQRPPQIHKANEFDLSGPAAAKTAISQDGNTLLVLDTEGALVTWNLKTGEQVARILPEQASPESAIAISNNGKLVLIGFPSGMIEVYVPPKEKPAIQYDAFKTPIQRLQFSADQDRLIAVDPFGKSFEVDALGKANGFDPGPTKDTPIQSYVAAGGSQKSWWKIHVDPKDKVTDIYFDGHERSENHLELEPPQFIDSSHDNFLVGSPHQLAWVNLYYKGKEEKYEPAFKKTDVADTLYDAAFAHPGNWMWTLTGKQLEARESSFGRASKSVKLPADLPPEHTQILPAAETLVTITPEGHVTCWNAYLDITSGINRLSVSVSNESFRQRFDALEMIAQKWNGRVDHFEDKEHETPYTFLMRAVQEIAPNMKGDGEQTYPALHKWIEDNPDNCQFMRITLFRLYLADGYRARGSGYANTVPEEAWATFYDNMEKSWEVVAPVFDQKEIPAEAYTCAIIAGKNLQWEREEVNKYLRQAFEKYPNYHRTFAEEAVARLPRWGGRPGETGYLARFTADKLGGVEGDIMYARIAQHVAKFVGWDDIDTETDFSRERIMKGMVAITETTQDAFTFNQTLLLAAKWEDEEAGLKAAKRLVELDLKPWNQVWPNKYDLIDKVYTQAKGK